MAVFSGGGGGRLIRPSLPFSLPRLSFRLVMPGSGCRLQRACVLLVAGAETWEQRKKKKKQMKRKQMNIELG